jgi:hypothetical protein
VSFASDGRSEILESVAYGQAGRWIADRFEEFKVPMRVASFAFCRQAKHCSHVIVALNVGPVRNRDTAVCLGFSGKAAFKLASVLLPFSSDIFHIPKNQRLTKADLPTFLSRRSLRIILTKPLSNQEICTRGSQVAHIDSVHESRERGLTGQPDRDLSRRGRETGPSASGGRRRATITLH